MKIPLKWLEDYVPLTLPVAELAERLTLAGLEVSGVRLIGVPPPEGLRVKSEEAGPVWDREKIVVAQVLSVAKHPNADKLKLPTVDYGQGRTKKMVTGAPNLHVGDAGQKVILALAGSVLYDGHATPKKLSELKPGNIRGEPSDAMVCSSFELGIDDEHEGIILLEDDAPVGAPLVDFMGDVVLELEVTPNLARCLSLIGVAREVAALTGQTLKLPPHVVQATGEPVEGQVRVIIDDPKLSSRYAAVLLKGVKIGPAPGWMQRRLTYAGMRPISNVVDITNYVMLEWGQPLHAFDYDALRRRAGGKAPTITVRPARAGEVLKTLDGVDRRLTPEMLVIADDAGPVALAGVMGGAETEVSAATTNVLLESANFDFLNIRRTIKALNLPSEASMRFSRGIHPELVKPAAERAAELMRQHAGATVCRGIVDVYPARPAPQVVELRMAEVRRILGMDFPADEAARLLRALEFRVERAGGDVLIVSAPPHRLDIQEGPADLIEDLARLHGYDRLPATLLAERLPPQTGNPALEFEERVRDLLVGAGLQETINYALTTPEREELLGVKPTEYVRLLNPISSERSVMRQSVLASVLDAAAANLRHTADVRLFEIGHIYIPRPGARLPEEPRRLAVVLCGRRTPDFWGEADKASGRARLLRPQRRGRGAGRRSAFAVAGIPPVVGRVFAPRQGGRAGGGRTADRLFWRTAPEDGRGVRHGRPTGADRRVRPGGVAGGDAGAARLYADPALPRGAARRGRDRAGGDAGRASGGRDPGRRRRPVKRPAPVRPLPRRQYRTRRQEPGLRPDVSGRRPYADGQGGGQGAQEDSGPAQACLESAHSRRVISTDARFALHRPFSRDPKGSALPFGSRLNGVAVLDFPCRTPLHPRSKSFSRPSCAAA